MRIAIAGVPRAGKTTLAEELSDLTGWPVYSTDDLIHLGWSEASEAAAAWFDRPGPWIIEGVAVPRALRKWMAANDGQPCDRFVWMARPRVPLTPGQQTMAKGCDTVYREIEDPLEEECVEIYDPPKGWTEAEDLSR